MAAVDTLSTALARTADVRAASWAAVEHLQGPGLRPSVYIERGGRLRCQALSGYRQLLDGLPPWTGVIGRTYATGEANVVQDVREDPQDLPPDDGVVADACFPLRCGGRIVGVVNVKSDEPLDDDAVEDIRRTANALAARVEALGGPIPESPSQRLVRHAIALATQFDVAGIERAVVTAAVDITPMRSALLLVRPTPDAAFVPACVHGPLGPSLAETPAPDVTALAAFTTAGCSIYTVAGEHAGEPGAGADTLRLPGASSLAVLAAGPDRILVVADATTTGLSTEHCELLELLAAQASACLRTATSVRELRTLASTDALTGLGHHATFHAELAEARADGDVGVLVIDVDRFKAYNDRHGHPAGDVALRRTAEVLAGALRRGDALFRIGGDEFAALLPGAGGESTLEIARRLHDAVADGETGLRVSIGAASAAEGEDGVALLSRADRALYVAKEQGRDGVALDRTG
ncbi:MAG: hypothetical protein JWO90_2529 [Solirubrobacterales bacterium]|jgi:diguanylate cyclase (GGDEF)-like protein|nr:hypothetical protein [Solirubrobacterales bacterium]